MRQHKAGRAHGHEKSQRKLRTDDHRGSTGVKEKSSSITETVEEFVSAPAHDDEVDISRNQVAVEIFKYNIQDVEVS